MLFSLSRFSDDEIREDDKNYVSVLKMADKQFQTFFLTPTRDIGAIFMPKAKNACATQKRS